MNKSSILLRSQVNMFVLLNLRVNASALITAFPPVPEIGSCIHFLPILEIVRFL